MNKQIINVPDGIRYISDWKNFNLPNGHYIIDKGVTGCGFTDWCLMNDNNIILCSPRRSLLVNKKAQHFETNISYIQNNQEYVGSFDSDEPTREFNIDENLSWSQMKSETENFINYCFSNLQKFKILVTYDSLKYVLKTIELMNIPSNSFFVVVDEFQNIFMDSSFKSGVELDFIEYLQNISNVCYLSATPMLDKYLNEMIEFRNLPYYEFNWPTNRVKKAIINKIWTKSLSSSVSSIINDYLNGNFPKKVLGNKDIIESKELTIFCNSVTEIIRIINKCGLTSNNTIVVCADTDTNKRKLKKIKFSISEIPTKNQIRPMFTFCTRTVYVGTDFYSPDSTTVVLSDPNIQSLALDISIDLPQIMGRQRLDCNPWKYECTLFYKSLRNGGNTEAEFLEALNNKIERSKALLEIYENTTGQMQRDTLKDKYISDIRVSKYSKDFVGISRKTGNAVYNKLVELSYRRAWEVSQKEFQNLINVIGDSNFLSNNDSFNQELNDFTIKFNSYTTFPEKMKLYADFIDSKNNDSVWKEAIKQHIKDPKYESYYNQYGSSKALATIEYRECEINKSINNNYILSNINSIIYNAFKVGSKYLLVDIKTTLQTIYNDNNIQKTSKANDIENWFDVKLIQSTNKTTGKRDKGYKILGLKK